MTTGYLILDTRVFALFNQLSKIYSIAFLIAEIQWLKRGYLCTLNFGLYYNFLLNFGTDWYIYDTGKKATAFFRGPFLGLLTNVVTIVLLD